MWITVQDIIDAAKKNGYPWGKHNYIVKDGKGNVVRACVFGQAALNLDVDPDVLINVVEDLGIYSFQIWRYNDEVAITYTDAAAKLEEALIHYADKKIRVKKGIEKDNIDIEYSNDS